MATNFEKAMAQIAKGTAKTVIRNVSNEQDNAGYEATQPFTPVSTKEDALSSLNSQIQNYEERMKGADIDPSQFTDTRNPLEKWLNLREGQNPIFDIFEIINRPQQALFGGFTEALEGGSFGEGLSRGWTGKERDYSGGGMIRALTTGSGKDSGKIDLTDFAGFALDVMLDPADLAFLGAGKVAKGLDAISDVATKLDDVVDSGIKAVKASRDAVYASKAVKTMADTVTGVRKSGDALLSQTDDALIAVKKATMDVIEDPVLETAQETAKIVDNLPQAQKFEFFQKFGKSYNMIRKGETMVSPSDLVVRAMFGTAKGTFGAADDVISALSKTQFASKFGLDKGYDALRHTLGSTFNYAKAWPKGTVEALKKAGGRMGMFLDFASRKYQAIDDVIKKFAVDDDEAMETARVMDTYYKHFDAAGKINKRTIGEILRGEVSEVWPYNAEQYEMMAKALNVPTDRLGEILPVVTEDGYQYISVMKLDKNYIKPGIADLLNTEIEASNLLTPEDIERIRETVTKPWFSRAYSEVKVHYDDLMNRGIPLTGLSYKQGEGYMRNVMSESAKYQAAMEFDVIKQADEKTKRVFMGNTQVTARRAYPTSSQEANRWSQAARAERFRRAIIDGTSEHFKFAPGSDISVAALKAIDPQASLLKQNVIREVNAVLASKKDLLAANIKEQLAGGFTVPQPQMTDEIINEIQVTTFERGGKVYDDITDAILDDDNAVDALVHAKKNDPEGLRRLLIDRLGSEEAANRMMVNLPDDYRIARDLPVPEPEIPSQLIPDVTPKVDDVPIIEPKASILPEPEPEVVQPKQTLAWDTTKNDLRTFTPDELKAYREHQIGKGRDVPQWINDKLDGPKASPIPEVAPKKVPEAPVTPKPTFSALKTPTTDLQVKVEKQVGYIYSDIVDGKLTGDQLLSMTESGGYIPKGQDFATRFEDTSIFPEEVQTAMTEAKEMKKAWNAMPFGPERDAFWADYKAKRNEVGEMIRKAIVGDTEQVVEPIASKVETVAPETTPKVFKKVGKDFIEDFDDDDAFELNSLYGDYVRQTSDKEISEDWMPNLFKPNKDGYIKLTDSVETKIHDAIDSGEVGFTEEHYRALKKLDDTYGTDFTSKPEFDEFRDVEIDRTPEGMTGVSPKDVRKEYVNLVGAKKLQDAFDADDLTLGRTLSDVRDPKTGKFIDSPSISPEVDELIDTRKLVTMDMEEGVTEYTPQEYQQILDGLDTRIGEKARNILNSNDDIVYTPALQGKRKLRLDVSEFLTKNEDAIPDEFVPKVDVEEAPTPKVEVEQTESVIPEVTAKAPEVELPVTKVPEPVVNPLDDATKVLDDVKVHTALTEEVTKKMANFTFDTVTKKENFLHQLRLADVTEDVIDAIDTPQGWDMLNKYADQVQTETFQSYTNKIAKYAELKAKLDAIPTFDVDLKKAVQDWSTAFSKTAKNAEVYQAFFGHEAFSDINTDGSLVRFIPFELDEKTGRPLFEKMKIPHGYEVIGGNAQNELVHKLRYFNGFMGDKNLEKYADEIAKFDVSKGKLVLEKNMLRIIDLDMQRGSKDLLKLVDFANNLFKRFKLLTPGFNIRNVMGISTNMWLSGMSVQDITKYMSDADNVWKKYDEVMEKFVNNPDAMLPEDTRMYNIIKQFTDAGFTRPRPFAQVLQEGLTGVGSEVQDIQNQMLGIVKEGKKLSVLDKVTLANGWMNETMDAMGRTSVLLKAMDDTVIDSAGRKAGQVYMDILGVDSPAEAVRLVMFDPNNISAAENSVMKRLVPFYTFTKMNLVYHMENMPANAKRYYRLYKAMNATWDMLDINEEDVEDYKLVNMYLPLPGMKEDGTYYAIKANLPNSDFAEWVSNPLGRGLASMTPLIKAPFEAILNKNVFTGREISEFKGQKSTTLPFLDKNQEYALSQTGIDAPLRSLGALFDVAKGDVGKGISNFTGMGSIGNVQNTRISNAYKELDELKDGVRYLKQEGIELPTLAELENQDKGLENVGLTLDQLLGLRK